MATYYSLAYCSLTYCSLTYCSLVYCSVHDLVTNNTASQSDAICAHAAPGCPVGIQSMTGHQSK
jgi:hypothetical protein